jgi:hypothetical protein
VSYSLSGEINGALLCEPKESDHCTNKRVHKGVYAEREYSLSPTVLHKVWDKTHNSCRVPERTLEAGVYWKIGVYHGLFGELVVSGPG